MSSNRIDQNVKTFSCIRIRNAQNIVLISNQCQAGGLLISSNGGYSDPNTILTINNNFTKTSGYLIAYDNVTQSQGSLLTPMIYDNGFILSDCKSTPSDQELFPGIYADSVEILKTKNKFYCKRKKGGSEDKIIRSASKCYIKVTVTKKPYVEYYATTTSSSSSSGTSANVYATSTPLTTSAQPLPTCIGVTASNPIYKTTTSATVLPSSYTFYNSVNNQGQAKVAIVRSNSTPKNVFEVKYLLCLFILLVL